MKIDLKKTNFEIQKTYFKNFEIFQIIKKQAIDIINYIFESLFNLLIETIRAREKLQK